MTLTTTQDDAIAAAAPASPSEGTARMADGTLLRTLHWPAPPDGWATALIVHGLGEHAGRYDAVAEPLAAAGLDVHGYDQRGFGGSAGPRTWVERWSQLHDDLEERIGALRAGYPGRPLVLYGHSMGGLVAGGYVLADPPRPLPDLLVLSAPSFDDDLGAWRHALVSVLAGILPRMSVSDGIKAEDRSRDPAVGAAFEGDPFTQRTATLHMGREAFAEQARIRAVLAALDAMPVPTYVFHGSADRIVPVTASQPIATKGNVTRRVHEGLRHETHHEPEHEQVMAEVVEWLVAQRAEMGAGARTGAGESEV